MGVFQELFDAARRGAMVAPQVGQQQEGASPMICSCRPERRGPLRVLIAAGGTGGHVFPGIAVAEEVRERSGETLFVGTPEGLESRAVPKAGFDIELIKAGKLKKMPLGARLTAVGLAPRALLSARRILKSFDPDVVVGAGGYVSAPAGLAAKLSNVPVVLLEQNSIPGFTNRTLARMADRVAIAFAEAEEYLPEGRAELLGNPLRKDLVRRLAERRQRLPRRAGGPTRLLVLGGSQGARAINDAMAKAAPLLGRLDVEITHQTGQADRPWVEAAYRRWDVDATVHAFIDDMAEVYAGSDLGLCRAGATTIAELTLCGLPAVLVPFPHAADDHQRHNARALELGGGAVCLEQREMTAVRLVEEIAALAGDPDRLEAMSEALGRMARPDAAAAVVDLCERVARREVG
jgi:UDP-N-acetylglucosamine--N-acetylmuramyl-(pentapeptide) pyrophosphoryl-undecaprenol N-acetylglucosamine transferase